MNETTFQEEPKTEEVGRAFCLRVAALFAFPLLTLLFAAPFPSRMAQADPIEVDYFPDTHATVELENTLGTPFDTVMVAGPTTVNVDLGSLGDGDSDGREQIQTEIVQMQLTGTSTIYDLPVILKLRDSAKDPFRHSLGEMEETINVQVGRFDLLGHDPPLCVEYPPPPPPNCLNTTADSFFDVYFEVEVPDLGMILHNRVAKHMETTITHKPPAAGETYEDPVAIRLYDELGNETDWWVAATSHTPKLGIGGIAEAPDVDASALGATTSGGSSDTTYAVIAGIAAGAVLLGAGGWYARKRWGAG